MRTAALLILATCATLGGVGCAPQTVTTGPGDPGVMSLLDGQESTSLTTKLHVIPSVRLAAGEGVMDQRVAFDLPERTDLTGFWTRDDFGIPEGGWAEAASYLIDKPDGGRLKITTSRTDLSVLIKRVGAERAAEYDGGELMFASTVPAQYAMLIAPAGSLRGSGAETFELTTEIVTE